MLPIPDKSTCFQFQNTTGLLFFLGIFLRVYLYRGFILVGPPSEELGVNVGVRSLHLQRVQPFIFIVHRLREGGRERDGSLVT